MPKVRVPYSEAEKELIRKLYPLTAKEDILAALPGRPWGSISSLASGLGVKRGMAPNYSRAWSAEHEAILHEYYPTKGAAYVGALVGRPAGTVLSKAGHAKLKRKWAGPTPKVRAPRPPKAPKPPKPKKEDKEAREARLKKLYPNRYATPKATKPKPVKVAKPTPAPKPVAVAPEPVKRSPATPILNARVEQRRLADKQREQKPKPYVTADQIRSLSATHPARVAYTRAAYNGPAAATAAFYEAMNTHKQAA